MREKVKFSIPKSYVELTTRAYSDLPKKKFDKIMAAATYLDNRLKKGHFDSIVYLKYFDYDALGHARAVKSFYN